MRHLKWFAGLAVALGLCVPAAGQPSSDALKVTLCGTSGRSR
jgi:hypothetical protein